MQDVEFGVAYHIYRNKSFDLLGGPVLVPLRREVLATERAVTQVHLVGFLDRLFAIEPYDPDAIARQLAASHLFLQLFCYFQGQTCTRPAVVSAQETFD